MKYILVIDDDDNMRSVIAATLVVAGYAVQGARNGREGIMMVLADRPGLILCDINMASMDGYRTLEAIRKYPGTADIPFIMMTGSVIQSEFRRAMDCGADDYLSKPFSPVELVNAVKSRLARHSQSQREVTRRLQQLHEHETRFLLNSALAEKQAAQAVATFQTGD